MKKNELIKLFKESCVSVKSGFSYDVRAVNKNGKKNRNDEYYTPKSFIDGLLLGNNNEYFDLDAASSFKAARRVKIANKIYTKKTNGLIKDWGNSYVFLNPPFSDGLFVPFIRKMVEHDNGILLVFEIPSSVSKKLIESNCSLIMKFRKRLNFDTEEGTETKDVRNYTTLYAFGEKAAAHLLRSKKYLEYWDPYILIPEHEILKYV